jgi:hypothetical protein
MLDMLHTTKYVWKEKILFVYICKDLYVAYHWLQNKLIARILFQIPYYRQNYGERPRKTTM